MALKNSKPSESAAAVPLGPGEQTDIFNQAMQAFHQRDFRQALPLFETAAQGPIKEMAFSARTHARMCESRLAKSGPEIRTAEENYTYAIARMNLRDFPGAAELLEFSLNQQETDYANYALAAALGHQGQIDRAAQYLRRAIQIQPRNRAMAISDPDFVELAKFQPIRDLLTGS